MVKSDSSPVRTSSSSSSSSSRRSGSDKISKKKKEKKDRSHSKKEKEKAKEQSVFGYTNSSNPFGDSNLTSKFVWRLKHKRDKEKGIKKSAKKEKWEEIEQEIVKMREKRKQRKIERRMIEEEQAKLARLRATSEFGEWEEQEAKFLLEQAQKRIELHLEHGRGTPLDRLYACLKAEEIEEEPIDPLAIFRGLSLDQLESMRKDLGIYVTLDSKDERTRPVWKALEVVCEDEIEKTKGRDDRGPAGVHKNVESDILKLAGNKDSEELGKLVDQVQARVDSGNVLDGEYWEAVLKRLKVERAKTLLNEVYIGLTKKKVYRPPPSLEERREERPGEEGISTTTRMDDSEGPLLDERELYRLESERPCDDNEEIFNEDLPLEERPYLWKDKYRPRKPKFFNRIRTGYEWNKYNRAHYDHDNPPPKIVQGYKFNIFYPDLLDKRAVPTYHIERDPQGDGDTCFIRFHAGPPYEDIAFRIVNLEWEQSRKKGFRCTFEGGVLHLWFNFKRFIYRR